MNLREALEKKEIIQSMKRMGAETTERMVEEDDGMITWITAKSAAKTIKVKEDPDATYMENHYFAATTLLSALGWPYERLIGGANVRQDGYNFVLIEKEEAPPKKPVFNLGRGE